MRARVILLLGSLALALATSLAPSATAQPAPIVVEGFAAVIGGAAPGPGVDLVLRSDVELRARIVLAGRAADRPLPLGPIPRDLLRAVLDEVVGQLLIAREAERVRVAEPTEAQIALERRRLEELAGGAARLRELVRAVGAAASEIDVIARRRATVVVFLDANLEGTTVITDAQVERAFAAGGHPFAEQPLEEAREPLRAWLARQALERAVRRWVGVLRGRTVVRVLASF
jgi:hypothetical protein